MSAPSQEGTLAIGPQVEKGTEAGTYHRYAATRVQGGAMQMQGQFPPEVGGTITPTGAYKAGAYFALTASLVPRLLSTLGWLLYGAMGAASDVAAWGGEEGVYGHLFTFAASESTLPWMSAIKNVEGMTEDLAEKGLDCKIGMLDLGVTAADLVAAQLSLVGRVPSMEEDASMAGYTAVESYPSAPVGNVGHFKVNSVAYPTTGVRCTLANGLTSPQQEFTVGNLYPDDFTALGRVMSWRWQHKLNSPDLIQQIYGNSASATAWSTVVFESAAELLLQSPANISGKNQPYALKITTPVVTWAIDRPPELVGAGLLMASYVGTVQKNPSGNYCEVLLVNEEESYTWPT